MYEVRCIDGTVLDSKDDTLSYLLLSAEMDSRNANLYLANAERHLHFKYGMGYYVAKLY